MIEIEKPRIECQESPDDISYGKFVVEPLERGYGTTLGNSLRRVLLSSLPGTAPTSIRIAGVQHEFSTIPGVKEDVTEIVLNVKGIIARLHCDGPKTVYIEAAGECEVTAGDIKADGEVEILNPELHIASLGLGLVLQRLYQAALIVTPRAVADDNVVARAQTQHADVVGVAAADDRPAIREIRTCYEKSSHNGRLRCLISAVIMAHFARFCKPSHSMMWGYGRCRIPFFLTTAHFSASGSV